MVLKMAFVKKNVIIVNNISRCHFRQRFQTDQYKEFVFHKGDNAHRFYGFFHGFEQLLQLLFSSTANRFE